MSEFADRVRTPTVRADVDTVCLPGHREALRGGERESYVADARSTVYSLGVRRKHDRILGKECGVPVSACLAASIRGL
jgi:hypothetical protein